MIFGISVDSPEDNRSFAENYNFPYKLLCDESREVGVAYHALKSTDGGTARRITYVIHQGKIIHSYKVKDVSTHAAEVLADLT